MNPLIGRTCVVVDLEGGVEGVSEPQEVRTPGIIMDLAPGPTAIAAGQASMSLTETWVLLVLLEGGRLRCIPHRDVIMT